MLLTKNGIIIEKRKFELNMSFFSRPDLSDLQFKQLADSELHLSGTTYFMKPDGLQIAGDSGTTIPIVGTGATDGFVLTYYDGSITLQASSASGGTTIFDTYRPTTRLGVPEVNVGVEYGGTCTINNFLEGYFFPAVPPSASICIASGGASREFGAAVYGNLCYEAIRETNPINLVAVNDNAVAGYNNIILSSCIAGDCCGTVAYSYSGTCPIPPTGTSQTSVSYGVCVETICSEVSVSSASIIWRNKRFTLQSTVLYTDGSISAALSGGELSTTRIKSLSNQIFNNQFFYYIYPTSFGTPTFTVNGLPNSAWGNAGAGTLFKIDYTNVNGYENQYYVARSDNRITGTYNIVIS